MTDRLAAGDPATAGTAAPAPRRLFRATEGRIVAGVCRGLADHLGVDVLIIRGAFVLIGFTGAGIVMYAAFWVFAPLGADAGEGEPERGSGRELGYLIALGTLAVGALVVGRVVGVGATGKLIWPLLVVAVGVALLWQQADDAQRARWRAATLADRRSGLLRAVIGVALVVAGLVAFVGRGGGIDSSVGVLLSALVVVAGLALISGPWWIRMGRELTAERAARIREQERAEVAAHVHDSVLHTLTLIQRHVEDPREVARLARAQERELRTWLYRPTADADTTLTAAVERAAADVEDAHGVAVEVVTVGDCPLDERLHAMLQAAREALVNAAKYAGDAPISLFAEVEPHQVTVFVRDRGPGFDVDAIPQDRLGVRQSIIGRMGRNGGTALVRSTPGEGTEIQLEMPRETT
jgi:signal transduction histidine kinase/phage shock protein PspC (stress-responsive transcriptional regulator)